MREPTQYVRVVDRVVAARKLLAELVKDELIALGVASASGADEDVVRFERHLKQHEARFLGGLAPRLVEGVRLEWRNGFVHAIREAVLPHEVWEQLLRLRVCDLVHTIAL